MGRRYSIVGDGPAGLYLAVELARHGTGNEVTVHGSAQPPGAGIVLDADFVDLLADRDPRSGTGIRAACRVWDEVRIVVGGREQITGGHVIHGISRAALVGVLRERAAGLGVRFVAGDEDTAPSAADVVVGADGAGSVTRARLDGVATHLSDSASVYLWMQAEASFAPGFWVLETEAGVFVAHVYPFADSASTVVVECLPAVARAAGAWDAAREQAEQRLTEVFAAELHGARLRAVTYPWRRFRTVRADTWADGNSVLIGDAAHTTHYSVGSGTRLAMEDAMALADALAGQPDAKAAFEAFEAARRPVIEEIQNDAESSRIWFEDIGRHVRLPADQFAFALRSRREVNTYGWLARRDPEFTGRALAAVAADPRCPADRVRPGIDRPHRLPLRLGDRVVTERILRAGADGADFGIAAGCVTVSVGERGQRVERTRAAERMRNEHGLTVLLRTPAITDDEADTLIAAGRVDGCVVGV